MYRYRFVRTLRTLRWKWAFFFNKRCLAGFPWFWPSEKSDKHVMLKARYLVRQQYGSDHCALYRALARFLAMTAWPPAVLVHTWQIRRLDGPKAVPSKRIPGALLAAMRNNILPAEYCAYALWQPSRRRKIDHFLYSNEASRLFKIINRPSPLPDPISDKLAFYEMCKTHAIPTPGVLAAFTPSGKSIEFESGSAPEHDLFVKPRLGLAGEGAECLRWHGTHYESSRGHRVTAGDLDRYITTRAKREKRTLLVQPVLSNHPDLRVKARDGLATARLVTGQPTSGDILHIFGYIYFARANRITAQDGYVALIDVASGRLLMAPQDFSGADLWDPPLERGLDELLALPDWAAVLRYTQIAHQACCNFVFVGWDVAFTHLGPMLLEGNANWGADEYQRLSGIPLGDTKFGDVLEARFGALQSHAEVPRPVRRPRGSWRSTPKTILE